MLFFTVLVLCILGGAEIDLFLPSFPEIRSHFGLSAFSVELMLGMNLAAHCLSSFISGSLGDRFGRKPVIIFGLVVFMVGSGICVLADHYWQVLLGRSLQGIGIAAPNVLAFVIIADLFPTDRQQRLLGVMNGIITLAMALAPVIGSVVNLYFHWRGNFTVLLILAILSLGLSLLYLPRDRKELLSISSPLEYRSILTSKRTMFHVGSICFLLQAYWVFIGMAPLLYIQDLHVSLKAFGFYQGALAAIFSLVSLTSPLMLKKYGQKFCFSTSLRILIVFMVTALFVIFLNIKNPVLITAVCGILAAGMIVPVNLLYPLALERMPNQKGKISAIITSLKFGLTAILVQAVSSVYDGTFFFVGIAMVATLLVAGIFGYQAFKDHNLEFTEQVL